MAEYKWPEEGKRKYIGKRISRIDGPDKVSGKAKYTYDINRPGMLFGKVLRSPHAHAKIVSIDISAAEKMAGVAGIRIIQGPGAEIQWALDEIAIVAAVDEPTAEDAARAIKVVYEVLPHVVNERDLEKVPATNRRPPTEQTKGDPAAGFSSAEVILEETYGNDVITHCCLETHGLVTEWEGENNVLLHQSTQSVSSIGGEMARALQLPAGNVHVRMDHIGGGFGSKFPVDRWGLEATRLSKTLGGRPIKLMLERDAELAIAGTRRGILHRFESPGRLTLGAVSWIDVETGPRSLIVHAFHTYPDDLAIVKSQSLFELP
jgi:xanthine dehydrogenase YagR molybdenum-binding subunit